LLRKLFITVKPFVPETRIYSAIKRESSTRLMYSNIFKVNCNCQNHAIR